MAGEEARGGSNGVGGIINRQKCYLPGIVAIVCHAEVLKLNQEAIVWQIILPDYLAGVCHNARPNRLRYIRTSYFRATAEYICALSEQKQKQKLYLRILNIIWVTN